MNNKLNNVVAFLKKATKVVSFYSVELFKALVWVAFIMQLFIRKVSKRVFKVVKWVAMHIYTALKLLAKGIWFVIKNIAFAIAWFFKMLWLSFTNSFTGRLVLMSLVACGLSVGSCYIYIQNDHQVKIRLLQDEVNSMVGQYNMQLKNDIDAITLVNNLIASNSSTLSEVEKFKEFESSFLAFRVCIKGRMGHEFGVIKPLMLDENGKETVINHSCGNSKLVDIWPGSVDILINAIEKYNHVTYKAGYHFYRSMQRPVYADTITETIINMKNSIANESLMTISKSLEFDYIGLPNLERAKAIKLEIASYETDLTNLKVNDSTALVKISSLIFVLCVLFAFYWQKCAIKATITEMEESAVVQSKSLFKYNEERRSLTSKLEELTEANSYKHLAKESTDYHSRKISEFKVLLESTNQELEILTSEKVDFENSDSFSDLKAYIQLSKQLKNQEIKLYELHSTIQTANDELLVQKYVTNYISNDDGIRKAAANIERYKLKEHDVASIVESLESELNEMFTQDQIANMRNHAMQYVKIDSNILKLKNDTEKAYEEIDFHADEHAAQEEALTEVSTRTVSLGKEHLECQNKANEAFISYEKETKQFDALLKKLKNQVFFRFLFWHSSKIKVALTA